MGADKTDTIGESENLQVFKTGGRAPPFHPSSYIAISSVLSSRPREFSFYTNSRQQGPMWPSCFSALFLVLWQTLMYFKKFPSCVFFFVSVILPFKQSISKLKSLRGRNLFSIVSLPTHGVYSFNGSHETKQAKHFKQKRTAKQRNWSAPFWAVVHELAPLRLSSTGSK